MRSLRAAVLAAVAFVMLSACGSTHATGGLDGTVSIPRSLLNGMRPIGAGARFHPLVTGTPTGRCAPAPGMLEAHVELFAQNRVVLIAAGVGRRGRCYGNAVTLDPTGTVHYRPGATLTDLFRAWGEPLSPTRLASFRGRVRYYLAGTPAARLPALTEHAEIVLEVGPYVPPHHSYTFPRGL